jgi:hypothetical protein
MTVNAQMERERHGQFNLVRRTQSFVREIRHGQSLESIPANNRTTLPLNPDEEEKDGQYASFTDVGKSYTSFGCTGIQHYMNLKHTRITEAQYISHS